MRLKEVSRAKIDELLEKAVWVIQDINIINLSASYGIAIPEFPFTSGYADYLLIIDGKAVAVIETKPQGTTLSVIAEQSQAYITGIPKNLLTVKEPLSFAYQNTSIETFFRDIRAPEPRLRRVFAFHKPQTLAEWLSQKETLRNRVRKLPPLINIFADKKRYSFTILFNHIK